ncbi:sugar ABC transporter substrate-binding protein [Phytohabitans rumicis]|uniref:sugar ABC transporter substrate-binding protein n=1 Tax=Phytohabitans rumicis TaxID=1076125 RepID=UPI0031F09368
MPNLSRRRVLQIGAAATAGPMLSACSRAPEASGSGAGTLTLYTNAGHAYAAWQEVIAQFENDHGVTVNWQKFQWPDLATKLQTDFAAGTPADLVEQPGGAATVALAAAGDVRALDDYIAKDGAAIGYPDDWQAAAVESWQSQGKTYGVQMALTCNLLFYNRQMFAAAGITRPPDTWDEFLAAAKELTRGGVHGFAANQDYSYSTPWLLENGVRYYDPAAKDFLVPGPAAIEALQFQADLVHKHKVAPVPTAGTDYSGPQKLFTAKRAAMILSGPWDLKPIREGAPDLDFGLTLPLRKVRRSTNLAGAGFFIPAKASKADLAWDLLKRIVSLQTQLKVSKEAGLTAPRKSWAADAEVKADATMNAVAQALPFATDWNAGLPQTGKKSEVDDAYKTLYQSVVLSDKPVDAAVKSFADAAKRAVG